MRRNLIVLALLSLALRCASSPDTPPPADTGQTSREAGTYAADSTPFSVGSIPNAVLRDATRNRDIAMVIEYPTRGGPYPVIVFSHGFGATQNAYVSLTEYWTGHGFVCILPQHADAGLLRERMREGARERMDERRRDRRVGRDPQDRRDPRDPRDPQAGAGERPRQPVAESVWQGQTEEDWRNRVRDVTFIVDSLAQIEQQYPELKGKMDAARVGVGGHSYGAFTAMLLAGATPFRDGTALRFGDSRVRAIVAMSPQGTGVAGLTAQSWTDVRVPAFYMTGSLDRGADEQEPSWRREPFQLGASGDKYLVVIPGARHGSFTGRFSEMADRMADMRENPEPVVRNPGTLDRQPVVTPPMRGAGPEDERRIFKTIKAASTAFWEAYLKDDAKARGFLSTELQTLHRGAIEVERK